jgi:hypothetical protein
LTGLVDVFDIINGRKTENFSKTIDYLFDRGGRDKEVFIEFERFPRRPSEEGLNALDYRNIAEPVLIKSVSRYAR